MRWVAAMWGLLFLGGCTGSEVSLEPGSYRLPRGPDFARLEAPMTHFGLGAYRRGDGQGLAQAREELLAIAKAERRPGDNECSREAVIARESERIAIMFRGLDRAGLLHATEEERFVYFESLALSSQNRNSVTCGIEHAERLEESLPSALPRSHNAVTSYYWFWREELSSTLGQNADEKFTSAAARLVSRGYPRGQYR